MIPIDEDDDVSLTADSTEKDNEGSDDNSNVTVGDSDGAGRRKFMNYRPTIKTTRRGTALPLKVQQSTTSTDEQSGG